MCAIEKSSENQIPKNINFSLPSPSFLFELPNSLPLPEKNMRQRNSHKEMWLGEDPVWWGWSWRWNLIKSCVWTCDTNSTLESVVPLAMFLKKDVSARAIWSSTWFWSWSSSSLMILIISKILIILIASKCNAAWATMTSAELFRHTPLPSP